MSDPTGMHLGEERLQRLADAELGAAETAAARRHLAVCADCRARLDAIGRAGDAYLDFHRNILKPHDSAPPRPWEDLRPQLVRIGTSVSRVRGGHWPAWAAVAAALIAVVAVYYRTNRAAPVSAAELLRKAAAVEAPSKPGRRIRLRTSRHTLVRPAVLGNGQPVPGEGGLEALFLAAHFSWQDPLSVRSFAAWRDQLPEKEDHVQMAQGRYEIHATTRSGPLHEATLVLDVRDLHLVNETLQFANEWVEIAEAEPPAPAQPASPPAHAGSPTLQPAEPAAGPALELRVIAALHAIEADLGEPVQVTRQDGTVTVEVTGLAPARERQVRDALVPIPGVTPRFDVPDAAPLDAAPGRRLATAPGVRTRLEGVLGEEGVNRILDASEAVMARVYALRGLSRRFPQSVEAQLADADRGVLTAIRSEHASGIRTHLRALEAAMAPVLPHGLPAGSGPDAPWQARAERIFLAAQEVDHLLNRILAGGEDFAQRAPELAEAFRKLDAEAAEVRQ